jgi:hypothetical protein
LVDTERFPGGWDCRTRSWYSQPRLASRAKSAARWRCWRARAISLGRPGQWCARAD